MGDPTCTGQCRICDGSCEKIETMDNENFLKESQVSNVTVMHPEITVLELAQAVIRELTPELKMADFKHLPLYTIAMTVIEQHDSKESYLSP